MHATPATAPRPPLVLARHPSARERTAARRRLAAIVGTTLVLAGAGVTGVASADADGTLLRVLGASVAMSLAIVAFVGVAYGAILGMVLLLEPLTRGGRLAGYLVEGALHAVLPFALLSAGLALVHELPEQGALHARAVPAIALFGALVGALRWAITRRGDAR
jgi:hypothetical protein